MAAPSAFSAIAWRYYFVFFSVTFVSIFVFAFYFPEVSFLLNWRQAVPVRLADQATQTKGLPLEEIAQKFGDHVELHLVDGAVADGTSVGEIEAKEAEGQKESTYAV